MKILKELSFRALARHPILTGSRATNIIEELASLQQSTPSDCFPCIGGGWILVNLWQNIIDLWWVVAQPRLLLSIEGSQVLDHGHTAKTILESSQPWGVKNCWTWRDIFWGMFFFRPFPKVIQPSQRQWQPQTPSCQLSHESSSHWAPGRVGMRHHKLKEAARCTPILQVSFMAKHGINESDVALQQGSKSHHQAGSTRLKGSRPCCIKHLQAHPPGVGHWNLPQDHPVRKGQWQWALARILSTAGRPRSDGKNPTFYDPKNVATIFFATKITSKLTPRLALFDPPKLPMWVSWLLKSLEWLMLLL